MCVVYIEKFLLRQNVKQFKKKINDFVFTKTINENKYVQQQLNTTTGRQVPG